MRFGFFPGSCVFSLTGDSFWTCVEGERDVEQKREQTRSCKARTVCMWLASIQPKWQSHQQGRYSQEVQPSPASNKLKAKKKKKESRAQSFRTFVIGAKHTLLISEEAMPFVKEPKEKANLLNSHAK